MTFLIQGNVQRYWPLVGVCGGTYTIVKGIAAHEWTVRPRRISDEPFKFTPQWYHRLALVSLGGIMAVLSLCLLLK